ncbi:MAG: hypothetical protein BGO78_01350 [Chloroflexi bacterium 44-23]|nr:MAG: hypothetical protein BGO78_01350 [Chloroflexi bacterium 44-23]
MNKIVINAEKRTLIGKQVRQLRRQGKLPAVIYGHKIEAQPISLDFREASKILVGLTSSSLIEVQIDGKPHPVIVREKQMDYIRDEFIHVDFQEVSLTELLRTFVVIHLEGEAPAVKDFNAVLVSELTEIEVEAFPQDLPEKFIVDVSGLKEIGDSILVKDIVKPDNLTILTDLEETIVFTAFSTTGAQEAEEELEEMESEEPEVIEKGKTEEEE